MKQDAYTKIPDDLCRKIGANAAMICAKVIVFTTDEDECTINLQYLADLVHLDKRSLRRVLQTLRADGYIEYTEGCGRGVQSVFKKGTKLHPYSINKRGQNIPLYDAEKGTNLHEKGDKMSPLNNTLNNIKEKINKKESANACELRDDSQRCARENRRTRIELLTRDEVHARFGTTAPPGWCMLLQRDNKGWARWADTAVAKAAGLQIEKEF